jgi:hypothetical protein
LFIIVYALYITVDAFSRGAKSVVGMQINWHE